MPKLTDKQRQVAVETAWREVRFWVVCLVLIFGWLLAAAILGET